MIQWTFRGKKHLFHPPIAFLFSVFLLLFMFILSVPKNSVMEEDKILQLIFDIRMVLQDGDLMKRATRRKQVLIEFQAG